MSTKQTEALNLALEALEDLYAEQNGAPLWKRQEHWQAAMDKAEAAMPAIREALAEQPAQQEQEPFCYHDGRNIVGKEFADHSDVFPLYTSPPASKPWVGLTQEDMYEIGEFKNTHGYVPTGFKRLAAAIEAKLREKNA